MKKTSNPVSSPLIQTMKFKINISIPNQECFFIVLHPNNMFFRHTEMKFG